MLDEGLTASGGVKLHYVDWGGQGRPILLLAGLGNTIADWRPDLPEILE